MKFRKYSHQHVKSVIFVPYTEGSKLAKELRQLELSMELITGYRMKVVERTGINLERSLHKSNPWAGEECSRLNCLPCLTKSKTGKFTDQSCSKRSLVYQTWCESCRVRDTDRVGGEEVAGGNVVDVKKVPLYTYIGATAKSMYERMQKHLSDMENYRTTSHLLKHLLQKHE